MRRVVAAGLGAALVLVLLAAGTALAADPPNDYFANATAVTSFPFSDSLDNRGATTEPDEPHGCSVSLWRTAWYEITPSSAGMLTVAPLAGTVADSDLALYRADGPGLAGLAYLGCAYAGQLTYRLDAGVTYYLQVYDAYLGGGTFNLSFTFEPIFTPPPSDTFEQATQIPGLTTPGFVSWMAVDMSGATYPDAGEPSPCGGPTARTVWYGFTADLSGTATVTMTDSDAGTPVVTAFVKRASDGGWTRYCSPAPYTSVSFTVYTSNKYYIQVADDGTAGSAIQLRVSFSNAPPNDTFSRARALASFWTTDRIDISAATFEPGESHPYCWGADRTAWYRYAPLAGTPPGAITFASEGFPAVGSSIAAYRVTGTGLPGLTPIGCGYGGLVFNVQAGAVYYIQVSDLDPPGEFLNLSWSLGSPVDLTPPIIYDTPADITALTTDPAGTTVSFATPTAVDDVSGSVPVTCTPGSGSLFAVGVTTVTCRARDAAGNRASTTFRVTVQRMLAAPPGVPIVSYDVLATPSSGWCWNTHVFTGSIVDTGRRVQGQCYAREVVDELDGTGSLNDGLVPLGYVGNQLFSLHNDMTTGAPIRPRIVLRLGGTYRITAISFYGGGPYGTPEPGALHALTVSLGGTSAHLATVPFGPGADFGPTNDRVDLTGTLLEGYVTSSIVLSDLEAYIERFDIPYKTFTIGEIVVEGEAVSDAAPPDLTLPGSITAEATGPDGAVVTYATSAYDVVDGAVPVACSPAPGSTFPLGTTSVTCSATDGTGNEASGSFTIEVVDTTPPAPVASGVAGPYAVDGRISISGSATDLVDPSPTLVCALAGPNGTTDISCTYAADAWALGVGGFTFSVTATDASGNEATASSTFDVVATYRSVSNLTRTWSSKATVAKDLVAILDSAYAAEQRGNLTAEAKKLAEYRAGVKAQAGKAFATDKAELLIAFSYGL